MDSGQRCLIYNFRGTDSGRKSSYTESTDVSEPSHLVQSGHAVTAAAGKRIIRADLHLIVNFLPKFGAEQQVVNHQEEYRAFFVGCQKEVDRKEVARAAEEGYGSTDDKTAPDLCGFERLAAHGAAVD
jgi:hypothetical protein